MRYRSAIIWLTLAVCVPWQLAQGYEGKSEIDYLVDDVAVRVSSQTQKNASDIDSVGACVAWRSFDFFLYCSVYSINTQPSCGSFANSGGSEHFSWSQLNGGFSTGNPHSPWGMVSQSVKTGLDYIVNNYNNFSGIYLTSGYRCPHGNANVGGSPTSSHMSGYAAHIQRPGWTKEEYEMVAEVVKDAGGRSLPYSTDPADRHMHINF